MVSLLVLVVAGVALLAALAWFVSNRKPQITPSALNPREYQPFPLISRTPISPNTFLFRFQLPTPTTRLGLPIGKHMLLKFTDSDGKPISRPYTPTTSDDELGYFEFVIKIYPAGKLGPYLAALPLNQTIDIRGPLGELEYHKNGEFQVRRKITGTEPVPQYTTHIGMIAGGTGITPMLQIIREIAKHSKDQTKISLIYANVTEADILLKSELDEYASQHPNIRVHYTLDRPTHPEKWKGNVGFVSVEMIQKYLPSSAGNGLVLLCGPKPMTDMMEKHLIALEFKESQYFKF